MQASQVQTPPLSSSISHSADRYPTPSSSPRVRSPPLQTQPVSLLSASLAQAFPFAPALTPVARPCIPSSSPPRRPTAAPDPSLALPDPDLVSSSTTHPINAHPMITWAKSGIWKPKQFLSLDTSLVGLKPTSFKQASTDPNWKKSMTEEYTALIANDTWELLPSQSRQNLVGCKWVYRVKFHSDGFVERYKARLVTFGNHQQAGIHYHKTLAQLSSLPLFACFSP